MRPLAKYQQKRPNEAYVVERFPGSVVEFFHHFINILFRYILKTTAFGKLLPDQTIGVFVQTARPYMDAHNLPSVQSVIESWLRLQPYIRIIYGEHAPIPDGV
jgi:hypothetical protein